MTTSDIISMVCSGISLIATIIIAVLQIIQSNRMEKFEHKQDERDEKRHEEDIKAEAVTFISKYYHDRGLIPLCAMAAMHNDLYYYSREMYREFCCKTVEVQNRILKYLELDLQVCNMDDFYKECINALQKLAHFYFPNGKFPFYENGKYIIRSLERYGSEKIPVERIHYKANDIPDNVRSYFEKHEDILQQLNDVSSNKIIAAINNCDICFEKLNIANVSDDVVEYIFDNCRFKLNDCMIRNVISHKKKNLLKMFENQPYSTIIKLEYQPLTEYVYENMKEYIEAVVLKKTIIEDEKEDIIDLLRRTLEESDLCANIIRLENFEIEKLADCLEQEIQNKRDKVGVVWNTLLEQNKIGISWENTMLYWKYYSISNYLKKFIEVNVDKLSVEKNNYVTDNFAKDIINAKFEDSVIKKLLPVLPMKTFDLDVEQLPENILAIMVECNYFGYTIEYYQSIAERNEDIAVEYIVKNQAEFYNSLEDFSMTKNVLERLLFEQKIPMDNREELFEKYAKTYMTEKIALNMNAEGFKVTKTLFDIAWEILSENQKERLMIANLELLNVDDMEKCFGELSGQYSVLTERTKRRNIKLDNTENNRKLVEYLKKIDYITSSWEEEKTDSNGNRQVISIGCKIKQKK